MEREENYAPKCGRIDLDPAYKLSRNKNNGRISRKLQRVISQRARSILFNVSFQIYDLGGKLVESSFPIFSRPFNRSNDVLILSLDFSTISFLSFFIAPLPPFLFRVSKPKLRARGGSVGGDLPLRGAVSFVRPRETLLIEISVDAHTVFSFIRKCNQHVRTTG